MPGDAEWLADLLRHGLIRGSFIPAPTRWHVRDLTRYRTHLVEERARLTNRLQAVLEDANVKLASVVTDVRGVSARAILKALLAGETKAALLAELARGRLRAKRDLLARAVVGRFTGHHAFMLTEHLRHLDYLEEAMERVSVEIAQRLQNELVAIELLDTVPASACARRRSSSPSSGRTSAASPAPSTSLRGPGCAPATPRAGASA